MIFGGAADAIKKSKEERGTFFKTLASTGEVRTRVPLEADSPVRMSNLPYFCAREEAIRTCIGGTTKEVINWPKRWTMNRGSGIHVAIQNYVLENIGAIDGMWRHGCGYEHGLMSPGADLFGLASCPTACENCGGTSGFTYMESSFDDVNLGLTGHPDGFWVKEKALWEFKTCGAGTYRRVLGKGPSVANRVQGGGYLKMLNRLLEDTREHWAIDGVSPGDKLQPFDKVYFLYVPMEDVSDVRIPSPDERSVPYEVDPDTRMIFYPLGIEAVTSDFDEAYKRVTEYRLWRNHIAEMSEPQLKVRHLGSVLPRRHLSCTCAGNAGQWKWGCDFAKGCMELGDKYEEKKDAEDK